MKALPLVLVLAAIGCGIAIYVQKANYSAGDAERIRITYAADHQQRQLKNDNLRLQDDLLKQEIAERTGKSFTAEVINGDRQLIATDTVTAEMAADDAAAVAQENLTLEWIEGGAAAFFLLLATIIGTRRNDPQPAPEPAT